MTRSPWNPTGLLLVLAGCNFAPLDANTRYRCQTDRSCAQANYLCGADFLCHPAGEDAGAAGGGGGGGGGAAGGGAGGGGGGGGGCVPTRSCLPRNCGKLDDGCGTMLVCSACSGADFCGGAGLNLCGQQICTPNGWCWENPYPQGNFLRAAWSASYEDVWAVGDVGTVLRFNGKHWSNVASPTRANLRGVFGVSPTEIWIVGDLGTVLHWDGTTLTSEGIGTTNDLYGVWSMPNGVVWVAGASSTLGMRTAASGWSLFAPATVSVGFKAIAGFSALDVWAVGDREVEHFNGTKFVQVPVAVPGGSTWNTLFSPSPDSLLAGGSGGLFATFDGGAWGVQQLSMNPNLRTLFGNGGSDLWATSDRGVYRWVGGTPQLVFSTFPQSFYAGAGLDGGEAMVVGTNGTWGLVAGDGGLTTNYYSGSGTDLNDVFAVNANTVAAVGGNSWLERFPNAGLPSWRRFNCSTVSFNQTLLAVWISPNGSAFATATANNTLGFKLGSPSSCITGSDNVTYPGVWGFPSGPTYYVGDRFTEIITDGGQPPLTVDIPNPGGTDYVWNAVWGSSPQEMFTVGTDGGILEWVDAVTGWRFAPGAVGNAELSAVYGFGAGSLLDVWAVGGQGTVLRRQGGQPFGKMDAGLTDDLRDVWVGGPAEVWTVGHDGGAWRFDGKRFSALTAPVRDLRRIHGAADAGVWAVGAGGAILFHP